MRSIQVGVHCLICAHNASGHAAPKDERVHTEHNCLFAANNNHYYGVLPVQANSLLIRVLVHF